jgi:hypothetical protein
LDPKYISIYMLLYVFKQKITIANYLNSHYIITFNLKKKKFLKSNLIGGRKK